MHAIEATFQNGVFSPVKPIKLPEGFQVTLWLDPSAKELSHLREEDKTFLTQFAQRRAEVFRKLAE